MRMMLVMMAMMTMVMMATTTEVERKCVDASSKSSKQYVKSALLCSCALRETKLQ